ncbi:MAG: hypothetical protein LBK41_06200 [Clostridiales bacterium]|nr:hypothetical protein [Clostridiales bacterium]
MEMRSRVMHEEWLKNCPCPIIRVDGTADCGRTASEIMERFYTKPGEPLRVYTALSVRWKNMLHRYFAPHNGK